MGIEHLRKRLQPVTVVTYSGNSDPGGPSTLTSAVSPTVSTHHSHNKKWIKTFENTPYSERTFHQHQHQSPLPSTRRVVGKASPPAREKVAKTLDDISAQLPGRFAVPGHANHPHHPILVHSKLAHILNLVFNEMRNELSPLIINRPV